MGVFDENLPFVHETFLQDFLVIMKRNVSSVLIIEWSLAVSHGDRHKKYLSLKRWDCF